MICDALLHVAGSWSRFCRLPEYCLFLTFSLTRYNYVVTLLDLQRFGKAKALLRKTTPVARRVLGQNHELVLEMRWSYGVALYDDDGATLDDLREAVMTLEELKRTARRVLGGAHPLTSAIEGDLRNARATRARETPPPRRTSPHLPPPGSA